MRVSRSIHVRSIKAQPFLVLRTVVEGRIPWRFLPVTDDSNGELRNEKDEHGIWLPGMTELQVSEDRHPAANDESEEEFNKDSDPDDAASGTEDNADAASDDADSDMEIAVRKQSVIGVQSRFAALNLGEGDDGSEESEGESAD